MKNETFHSLLLGAIKERLHGGENIANTLMEILHLGKEAVYRRLRGEVPFTLLEAAAISKSLGISLDTIIGANTSKNRPFQIKHIDYDEPSDIDYAMLQNYVHILDASIDDPYSELTVVTNTYPYPFYYKYEHLCRFFHFKWTYHNEKREFRAYKDIFISDRLKAIQENSVQGHMKVRTSCYIFDKLLSLYLVNDLKYFLEIELITSEEIQLIKNDILKMLDYLESLAVTAQYGTNSNIYFYVSNINIESAYTYLKTHNHRISFIDIFLLNAAASTDEAIYEQVRTWVLSLRRLSTLISQSGELQRVKFFKEQRRIVDTL